MQVTVGRRAKALPLPLLTGFTPTAHRISATQAKLIGATTAPCSPFYTSTESSESAISRDPPSLQQVRLTYPRPGVTRVGFSLQRRQVLYKLFWDD